MTAPFPPEEKSVKSPCPRGRSTYAAETGADPRATFAVLDRLMREHLDHLADTPLGSLRDAG